jgi:HK97 family phage major capsid protein
MEKPQEGKRTGTAENETTPKISVEDKPKMKFRTYRDAQGNLCRVAVNDAGEDVGQVEIIERAGVERSAGVDAERARVRNITELASRFVSMPGANADQLARTAIADGSTVEAFQRQLLDAVNARTATPLSEQAAGNDIGLTDREARQFSIMRVIRALVDPTDRSAQNAAAFEFEASRAAAEQGGKTGERFVIPTDVLRRALNTSTAGGAAGNTGGNLIANELLSSSFVDYLRNRATIMRMGSVLGGLVGNIDIPKQVAAAQGYWLGEDDDATETGIELGQIAMTPKTVAAFSEITRKMLQQSSLDAEALVRRDLAIALALTMDKAGYYGSGSANQPLGIANQTGINAVAFADTLPTYPELVAMETAIALDNADVNGMAYVANAGFRGHAKTTLKFAAAGSATIWEQGGTVNGYRTEITNQVNAGDVFMGNFADLLIAMWGGLELTVDPYSGSKKGRLRLVVFQDVDYAVRRTESFCLGKKTV